MHAVWRLPAAHPRIPRSFDLDPYRRPGGLADEVYPRRTAAGVFWSGSSPRVMGGALPAARSHLRHGGFEGSMRVKFTGPIPQIAITTGSLWLRITPS